MAASIDLRHLRDELYQRLRLIPGVGAIGVAWTPSGDRCLRVSVAPGFAQSDKIPRTFHGVPVTIQTAGGGQLSTR